MRIIHTADWHIGQELYGFDRGSEHDVFLDWLARQLQELRVDALLVAGDVYDVVNPPISAQQRLYRFFNKVLSENARLEIVVVGGNHDSAARLELPRELLNDGRVHIFGSVPRVNGRSAPAETLVELHDSAGAPRVICGAIPYLRPGDLPVGGNGQNPVGALYREIVESISSLGLDLPIILTGHLHLSGAVVSESSERRIILWGPETVSSDVFPANVTYVALGHLHKPQAVPGKTVIRYSGSPFPMSVAEKDYENSIVLLDIADGGVVSTRLIPTPRPVAFYRIPAEGGASLGFVEAELQRLDLKDPGPDRWPFLEVVIHLDSAQPDVRDRVNAALKGKPFRLTRISKETAGDGGSLADCVPDSSLDDLEPRGVFEQLHHDRYGAAPPGELSSAFEEVLVSVLGQGRDQDGRE